MNLYKVYTGYEDDAAVYYLVTAETPEFAELTAMRKAIEDGEAYKLPMEVVLEFDNLNTTNISEISE